MAGILAAVTILCSKAFQKETTSILSKIKSEQTDQKADPEKMVIIAAPVDAVTSGPAVRVPDTNPSFIREIILDEDQPTRNPIVGKAVIADLFKTLFRAVISPQAP